MGNGKATITFQDGKHIEVDVLNVTIEEDRRYYQPIGSIYGSEVVVQGSATTRVSMDGILTLMGQCGPTGYNGGTTKMGEADTLALKIKNLDAPESTKKLKKHGILDSDGLLTRRGLEVVMNELFTDEVQATILEKLNKLDEEEKK